jgi:hypothetical protein
MWESIIAFITKHCGFLQCLPTWFFFLMIFLKLSSSILFFLILSWLRITITSKVKHVEKHCSFPHKTLWIATVFPTWFFCVFFLCFFVMFFFFNYLFWFYFFNIELVVNLALKFKKKHCGLLQCSPIWFFLLWFFPKLSLSILFF